MKLHKIEVTNLNSLYDDQVIDFEHDLDGASLFLIYGPTGAGKSTLMDAVSLALFGTTPRLSGRKGAALAEQVMSRGTATASAGLVFSKWENEVSARVQYRAIWRARRARKKPDGKLQAPIRSLERKISGGQWEMLVSDSRQKFWGPPFKRVLEGFTATDFQRSMLLAQGQFDAMLHAKPADRAAILERLTDTGEYQRIGERAARMRSAWQGRIEGLRQQLTNVSRVSPEELEAAQRASTEVSAALKELDAERTRLQSWQDWLRAGAALKARSVAEERSAEALAATEAESAPTLAALAAHERCAELFQLDDRRAGVRTRLAEKTARCERILAELPTQRVAFDHLQQELVGCQGAVDAAEAALEGLRGPASLAEKTTLAAEVAQHELQKAVVNGQRAQASLQRSTETLTTAQQALTQASKTLTLAQQASAQLSAVEALDVALPELQRQGMSIDEKRANIIKQQKNTEARLGELTRRRGAHDQAKRAHTVEQQKLVPLRQRVDAVRAELRALPTQPAALRATLEAARIAERRLEAAEHALQHQQATTAQQRVRSQAYQQAKHTLQEALAALADAEQRAVTAATIVDERTTAVMPLQRMAALGTERAELVEEEPCPLCGSVEHPYVNDPKARALATESEALLTAATSRLEEARRAHAQAQKEVGLARAACARAEGVEQSASAELIAATAEEERAATTAKAELQGVGLPLDTTAQQVASAHKDAIDVLEKQAKELKDVEAKRELERTLAESLHTKEQRLMATDTQLVEEASRLAVLSDELDARVAAIIAEQTALDGLEDRLRQRLVVHGVAALPEAIQRVKEYRAAKEALVTATVNRDAAEQAERAAREACAQATQGVDAAKQSQQHREQAVAQTQAERDQSQHALAEAFAVVGAVVEATTPAAMIRAAAEMLASAKQKRTEVLSKEQAAKIALADTAATLRALEEAQVADRDEISTLSERLTQGLLRLGLEEAALGGIRLDDAKVLQAKKLHQNLHDQRSRAEAVRKELDAQQRLHNQAKPEGLPTDAEVQALAEDQAKLNEQRAELVERQQEARATLQLGQRDRDARAATEAELQRVNEHAAVWMRLHDLIGTNRGQRFRDFAQALNLSQLLRAANAHLLRLNERYQLAAQEDTDGLPALEFQIEDQWRPGSARSLKTLSGGESFLVSLALALGLSDLRTHSMPVETLLLDEGFGTLDPTTLDTALAALQQLQSMGRQVGIISHVVGLQERIEARVKVEPIGAGRSRVRVQLGE